MPFVSPKWLSLLLSLIIFLTGQGVEQLVAATMASVQFSIFGGVVAGVPGLILGVPIGAYLINLWSKPKIVAVDFGLKRIGMARSDFST